ncbi:MAG: hypothetical protein R2941_09330 [Desulfobacterales bacterium]
MRHFSPCFKALQAENPAEIPPEYSLRPELEALLAEIAADVDSSISIRREGRREGKFGASDFKITRMGSIADYIENKKLVRTLTEFSNPGKSENTGSFLTIFLSPIIWNGFESAKTAFSGKTLCSLSGIEDRKDRTLTQKSEP